MIFHWKKKMKEWGFVHYEIAADSSLVTKNWISELSLVLRGEDIIETQSFNLENYESARCILENDPSLKNIENQGLKRRIIHLFGNDMTLDL